MGYLIAMTWDDIFAMTWNIIPMAWYIFAKTWEDIIAMLWEDIFAMTWDIFSMTWGYCCTRPMT
jgi:hypothetical protein